MSETLICYKGWEKKEQNSLSIIIDKVLKLWLDIKCEGDKYLIKKPINSLVMLSINWETMADLAKFYISYNETLTIKKEETNKIEFEIVDVSWKLTTYILVAKVKWK